MESVLGMRVRSTVEKTGVVDAVAFDLTDPKKVQSLARDGSIGRATFEARG